jgi:hypothetical protein
MTTGSAGAAMGGAGGAMAGGAGGGGAAGSGGVAGSGGATGGGGAAVDGGDDGSADAGDAANACGAMENVYTPEPGIHVAVCTPLTWSTNPPTSGMHYPVWAAFKAYAAPVPRGFYVHDMEHGAVVFEYNCPKGCAADVDALVAYLAARPADPLCTPPLTNRFVVTPDPLLDVPFAASAWGASLKMQCLDFAAIGAFIDAHYGKAPENFCFDGTDVLDPDAGYPADCGQPIDAGSD